MQVESPVCRIMAHRLSALVRAAFGCAVACSVAASTLTAQGPRFGPDNGQFATTFEQSMNTGMMGMSIDISMRLYALSTVTISERGRDTLMVHTRLDSLDFSMRSPMAEAAGGMHNIPLPMKKGDSAVFLMSSRGALLKVITGDEDFMNIFSSMELPADLKPGGSWDVVPPALGTTGGMAPTSDLPPELLKELAGSTRMTFVGEVAREGGRAWRFDLAGTTANKTYSPPGMTMTIKEMTSAGSTFIDTRGRFLSSETTGTVAMSMDMDGNALSSTSTSRMTVERVR